MNNKEQKKEYVPCDCPKGGMYSDNQVCKKCEGVEWISTPPKALREEEKLKDFLQILDEEQL